MKSVELFWAGVYEYHSSVSFDIFKDDSGRLRGRLQGSPCAAERQHHRARAVLARGYTYVYMRVCVRVYIYVYIYIYIYIERERDV